MIQAGPSVRSNVPVNNPISNSGDDFVSRNNIYIFRTAVTLKLGSQSIKAHTIKRPAHPKSPSYVINVILRLGPLYD